MRKCICRNISNKTIHIISFLYLHLKQEQGFFRLDGYDRTFQTNVTFLLRSSDIRWVHWIFSLRFYHILTWVKNRNNVILKPYATIMYFCSEQFFVCFPFINNLTESKSLDVDVRRLSSILRLKVLCLSNFITTDTYDWQIYEKNHRDW